MAEPKDGCVKPAGGPLGVPAGTGSATASAAPAAVELAFQHVAATGEVTPSGWQPGKPTLTPGPKLVGKVWTVWKTDSAFD